MSKPHCGAEKIKENFSKIKQRVRLLSSQADIMAVIKYASDEDVLYASQSGIKIMGENRVQDAQIRWSKPEFLTLRPSIDLHFIGNLQKNKVGKAAKIFDSIDSIDSIELAQKLNQKVTGKKLAVMIQLKINQRQSQFGVSENDFQYLFESISKLENLSLRGIMAIGPITKDEKEIMSAFGKAKAIYDTYFKKNENEDGFKNYLSMGMSSDIDAACRAGASLLRIGSALFERNSGEIR